MRRPLIRKGSRLVSFDQEVFDLDDTEEVVEALVADREPRVMTGDDLGADLFGRVGDVEPDDVASGRHQGPGSSVAEPEDPFDHLMLAFFKDAGLRALLQEQGDFLLGYRRLLGGANSERARRGRSTS